MTERLDALDGLHSDAPTLAVRAKTDGGGGYNSIDTYEAEGVHISGS